MNYRHHFHAGNFADVWKHALLLQLVVAMQRKAKGFLYLDTHAGRGSYDLSLAAQGDTLERRPEWPEGIGRLAPAGEWPEILGGYLQAVRAHDRRLGNTSETLRYYPGSPAIVGAQLREQDRMVLCERQPDESALLQSTMARTPRCVVQAMDGYTALRAMLPPPERRALVLIDPPYEGEQEFADIVQAVSEGLRRLPEAVIAIWYPLTKRARVDAFSDALRQMALPPTLVAELEVASEGVGIKLRGCGLVIINPPWQIDSTIQPSLEAMAVLLAQGPGARANRIWLVPER